MVLAKKLHKLLSAVCSGTCEFRKCDFANRFIQDSCAPEIYKNVFVESWTEQNIFRFDVSVNNLQHVHFKETFGHFAG
jgi:hypothetical protein